MADNTVKNDEKKTKEKKKHSTIKKVFLIILDLQKKVRIFCWHKQTIMMASHRMILIIE